MPENEIEVELDPKLLGQLLMNLDTTRELLGHKTFYSTFIYVNGPITRSPEFIYLKETLLIAKGQR